MHSELANVHEGKLVAAPHLQSIVLNDAAHHHGNRRATDLVHVLGIANEREVRALKRRLDERKRGYDCKLTNTDVARDADVFVRRFRPQR